MIKPYLRDLIDNPNTKGEWKTQLIMKINFILSKDYKKLELCRERVIT